MLEKHQEAPDILEPSNVPSHDINWERIRDAPLVDINGVIDWYQLQQEGLLGIGAEYTWTEETQGQNNDSELESFYDNEDFYDDNQLYDEMVCEYFLSDESDTIEWIPDEIENDEFSMVVG